MQRSGNAGPAVNSRPVTINDRWCKDATFVWSSVQGCLGETGGGKARVVHGEKCTKCGICEIMCPDLAITLSPAGDTKERRSGARGGSTDA